MIDQPPILGFSRWLVLQLPSRAVPGYVALLSTLKTGSTLPMTHSSYMLLAAPSTNRESLISPFIRHSLSPLVESLRVRLAAGDLSLAFVVLHFLILFLEVLLNQLSSG